MVLMNLKSFEFRPLRVLLAVCVSAFLFFSNVFPAMAATSQPTKGEDQLKQIEERSEEVLKSNPRSLEEVQSATDDGLNTVQGEANKNKMSRPENSQDATSVEEQIDQGLKGLFSN